MHAGADALSKGALFSGLDRELVSMVLALGRPRSFAIAETLMRQGEIATSMHVILTGRVRVLRRTAEGEAITLAELGPGEGVGEMGLIDEGPRSATVVAIEPTDTVELDAHAFGRLSRSFPRFHGLLARVLSRRLRRTNELMTASRLPARETALPMPLEEVRPKAIYDFLQRGVTRRFAKGETLLRQGEPSVSLFFILSGLVRVERALPDRTSPLRLAELGPGEFVGEMEVVDGSARYATVAAIADTTAVEVDSETVNATLAGVPDLTQELTRILSRRLRAATELVAPAPGERGAPPRVSGAS